ncbi:sulfatase-like hydrolase/transferase, partial [Kibdelosporangium lantanae]
MPEISRRTALLSTAAVGVGVHTQPPRQPARPRPNFLVILGDDLGWADLGCYGSPNIHTPNLDALGHQGIRFTNGYSAAAVCSPTRFALYTGRYPGRLVGGLPEPIGRPRELEGIPADHPTLGSLLRDAGYTTAMYGKWHCGYLPWYSPTRCGWQEFFGSFGPGNDYFSKYNTNGEVDIYENEVQVESLDYYTDTLADRATAFIRRQHQAPWLLNLNFSSPHWPWEGPDDIAVSQELTARVKAGEVWALSHIDGGSLDTYRRMVESLD